MNFPFKHVAGDTLDFGPISVPDFPSSAGWTLSYFLTPRFATPPQTQIVIAAVSNADGTYQLQAGPTATATWEPGAYGWSRRVDKTGARQTLTSSEDQGEVLVLEKAEDRTQGYDSRSHARRMLEQIETALEALNFGSKSYTIGSRSYTQHDKAELTAMHDRYLRMVADEDSAAAVAAGQQSSRKVGIRFDDIR